MSSTTILWMGTMPVKKVSLVFLTTKILVSGHLEKQQHGGSSAIFYPEVTSQGGGRHRVLIRALSKHATVYNPFLPPAAPAPRSALAPSRISDPTVPLLVNLGRRFNIID